MARTRILKRFLFFAMAKARQQTQQSIERGMRVSIFCLVSALPHLLLLTPNSLSFVCSLLVRMFRLIVAFLLNRYPANEPEKKLKRGAKRIVMG